MTDRWLRWYEGSIRDGKFRIVAEEVEETVATVIGVWAALLEDASASIPRGTISKSLSWHATYLQIGEERLGTVWNALERLDMIDVKNDLRHITNWCKRQFETDHTDPTSRQRKHKWKQRHNKSERFGTVRNGLERSGTPETDTDTDKKERSNAFDRFWKVYPKKVAKKAAEKAFAKALREVSIDTITEALSRQASFWGDPKFTPHPATWLNEGRWADVLPGDDKPKTVVSEEELIELRARYEEKQRRAL